MRSKPEVRSNKWAGFLVKLFLTHVDWFLWSKISSNEKAKVDCPSTYKSWKSWRIENGIKFREFSDYLMTDDFFRLILRSVEATCLNLNLEKKISFNETNKIKIVISHTYSFKWIDLKYLE